MCKICTCDRFTPTWSRIFRHQVVLLLKIVFFDELSLFCGQIFWPQLRHREWYVQNLHIPHSPPKPYFCKSRLQNRHFLNCASGTCTNERIGLAEPVAVCDRSLWTFKYSLIVRHLSEPVGKPDNLKCNFCTSNCLFAQNRSFSANFADSKVQILHLERVPFRRLPTWSHVLWLQDLCSKSQFATLKMASFIRSQIVTLKRLIGFTGLSGFAICKKCKLPFSSLITDWTVAKFATVTPSNSRGLKS